MGRPVARLMLTDAPMPRGRASRLSSAATGTAPPSPSGLGSPESLAADRAMSTLASCVVAFLLLSMRASARSMRSVASAAPRAPPPSRPGGPAHASPRAPAFAVFVVARRRRRRRRRRASLYFSADFSAESALVLVVVRGLRPALQHRSRVIVVVVVVAALRLGVVHDGAVSRRPSHHQIVGAARVQIEDISFLFFVLCNVVVVIIAFIVVHRAIFVARLA